MAVNGGATTTSTSWRSLTTARSSLTKYTASWTVLNIFQLAATKGRRMASVPVWSILQIRQGLDPRQRPAGQELERGAAARRDVGDLVGDARLGDGGDRVAATDDRGAVHAGDGLGDGDGAAGERVDLEHAHRAVPDHGPRAEDRAAIAFDGLRSDVDAEALADGRVGHRHRLV